MREGARERGGERARRTEEYTDALGDALHQECRTLALPVDEPSRGSRDRRAVVGGGSLLEEVGDTDFEVAIVTVEVSTLSLHTDRVRA